MAKRGPCTTRRPSCCNRKPVGQRGVVSKAKHVPTTLEKYAEEKEKLSASITYDVKIYDKDGNLKKIIPGAEAWAETCRREFKIEKNSLKKKIKAGYEQDVRGRVEKKIASLYR